MSAKPGDTLHAPDDTLAIALSLAKLGWPIFPVRLTYINKGGRLAVDKRPLVKWVNGATCDAETIVTWFTLDYPGAWVGVHTGLAGLVVVDVDADKGAGAGADNLEDAGIELPTTFTYPTLSGGLHALYQAPRGRQLTIGQDVPVPAVDIRAGNGFIVYYGPALLSAPALASAPAWSCISGEIKHRPADGDIAEWLARTVPGKPSAAVARAEALVSADGTDHDTMLEAVSELIKAGSERGAGQAFERARATYLQDWPDFERHWDNAARGSIGKHGLPPLTFELSKPERKAIRRRNAPEAVEAVKVERKRVARVEIHNERSTEPGRRVLEDGPLAVELSTELAETWAWTKGRGLMRYNGTVWVEAEQHDLVEAVRDWLNAVEIAEHESAVYRGDNKGIDKAKSLLSRSRARAVADLVIGRLSLTDRAFDSHPHLLNTPTGVVDLRDGSLAPHDPALMLTKITGVGYDPKAKMGLWQTALGALPGSVAKWVQVRLGQALTGHTPDDDVLMLFEGAGENGKTSLLLGVRQAFGTYAVTVPDRLLAGDPGDHPTTLMLLMGARLAVFEELPEGRNLNVKRLKDTVGTPFITARRMRQDDVTFASTHAMVGATNYLPIVAETDHGTWRRLALVRFPYRFVKSRKFITSDRDRVGDRRVKRHLEHAQADVLRWLVEGAVKWYANGEQMPDPPKRVRKDTEAWRLDADPVLGYVAERLEHAEGYAIATADLASDFNDHIERRGHRPWSAQTINARFEGHVSMVGVERKRVKFGRVRPSRPLYTARPLPPSTQAWLGVRFKDDAPTIPSEADRDAQAFADLERRVK